MSAAEMTSNGQFSRRTLLAASAAGAAAAVVATGGTASAATGAGGAESGAAGAAGGAVSFPQLRGRLATPSVDERPNFRWWWPGADVTPGEIAREINAMADKGFGGFEIGDVRNSEMEAMPDARYGWGSPAWQAGVLQALRSAKANGFKFNTYIGPYWPAVAAGILPDDDSAMKELTYGQTTVAGGAAYNAAIPAPHSQPSGFAATIPAVTVTPILQAVHAARISGSTTASPLVLEQDTLTDVTAHVSGGTLNWTAPAGGTWALIASYSRGTAMIEKQVYYQGWYYNFTDPRSFVVDHFGAAGTQAVIDWWNKDLLTPQMLPLLHEVGGTVFEDSLEFNTELHWTPKMLAEFKARRGYDLKPYLPLVQGESSAVFVLDDASAGTRVRWDYSQTLSDLFMQNHVTMLDEWAKTLGLRFRNQAYGAPVDSALSAAITGVPEGESLAFGSTPDSFRVLAAGRDVGQNGVILSSELGASFDGAYELSIADLVRTANPAYALGVNQVRIHGFPYATSPAGQWPGFFPWAPIGDINFADAWGPRQPQWQLIGDLSGYMARVHHVLRSGTNRVDLAIYREMFDETGTQVDGSALDDAGYSYQLLNWGLLSLPGAKVSGGVLAPKVPGYKALIIDNQSSMLLDSALTIVDYARKGLPVVIVGSLPTSTPGYKSAAAQDKALAGVLKTLTSLRGVVQVAAIGDVPAALAQLGVSGSAIPTGVSGLNVIRRVDNEASYFFALNTGSSAVSGTIALEASGVPYSVNPWTGVVTPIAVYDSAKSGYVTVPISVQAGEAAVYVVAQNGNFAVNVGRHHAVSATSDVVFTDNGLAARATAAGTYSAVLDSGRTVTATIGALPAAVTPASWSVSIEDWQPTYPGGTEQEAVPTTKTVHNLTLTSLSSWQKISGYENVAGIGTYTTTVTLPAGWSAAAGAYLDLGSIGNGSAHVSVNGTDLGAINQINPVIDLGDALKPGKNTLVVTVATTLLNRLRETRPTVFTQPAQDYGLIGPVSITPYGQAPLA